MFPSTVSYWSDSAMTLPLILAVAFGGIVARWRLVVQDTGRVLRGENG